jgi:hypothetical protein
MIAKKALIPFIPLVRFIPLALFPSIEAISWNIPYGQIHEQNALPTKKPQTGKFTKRILLIGSALGFIRQENIGHSSQATHGKINGHV